ncbi:MAG: molecular chaperone TorD family protein [Syntrophales bacterium]|nr:molecular chaperone TorD family protein [Syntrophales bacterium]
MTRRDKASFCALAAMLLAPPEEMMLAELDQDELLPWLEVHSVRWGAEKPLVAALFSGGHNEDRLSELMAAYDNLFGQWNGAAISLVESTYKPWSEDRDCGMVFAKSKGLLMGDSAVHMNELYSRSEVEVPERLKSMPDHIVLIMEFLSMLYDEAPEEKARCFLEEHLDWFPLLRAHVEAAVPHPFYESAVTLIDLFLREEQKAREV